MAIVDKRLCSGTLSGSEATLYTVPAGTYTIIKALTLCNKTSAAVPATLSLDGIEVICQHDIAAYDTITIPFMDQILEAGELIQGSAESASAINYYISGKEVS